MKENICKICITGVCERECVCVPVRLCVVQTEDTVAGVGYHQLLQPVTQLLREIQQLHVVHTQTEKQFSVNN